MLNKFYTETDVKLVDQLIERYQAAIDLGEDLTYYYIAFKDLDCGICAATYYELGDKFIDEFMQTRKSERNYYYCPTPYDIRRLSQSQSYIDVCLMPRLNRLKELRLLMN